MYADSLAELETFAARVGLKPSWLQNGDGQRGLPHYDVTGSMLDRAIQCGALRVDKRDGNYVRLRRAQVKGEYPMARESGASCGGSG
jgi:hypothetical protein